ncbi:MAG: ABC transporter ATP-binding protein [Peptostreptococcaceae bacterium]|nr:ABC transporter ATP-binding protein [Peptostreptococcaceae bacterium]
MNILEFNNVSFSYLGYEPTLENLSFCIDEPKSISIIGPSGCGKTTIFKLILSLLKMQKGDIKYNGKNISTLKSYAGYMPQKDLLFQWKTIEQNLSIPMDIQKIPKDIKKERIKNILEEINLYELKDKYPYELSGGMRQRISFARTILTGSDLLLFDEPLSALDYITRLNMQEFLLKELYKYKNKTAIFITHDIQEAVFLSDEIFVITQMPIKTMYKIKVNLPKRRTIDMLNNKEILDLKQSILSMIIREQI